MIARAWVFAAVMGSAVGPAAAGKVCDLAFSECPNRLPAGIVKVPNESIWLDSKIPFCDEYVQIKNGDAKPPSVVFIIDNSGSMDANDPKMARFDVVSALLDNIHTFAPATEVGLVVFTRRLSFDHRDNPFFKTAFPGDTSQHDSFVPLTALNKTFPNGRRGLDTLKSLLKHNDRGNLAFATTRPASRDNSRVSPNNIREGTDISLGFQAAKVAMKDSKSDKGSRYFIFLSDGDPGTPDKGREDSINEFILGAAVPTTFTVFFDPQNSTPVAPATIVQMTANIRTNGYSPSNPKSFYWAINLPGSQLQNLLQTQVIGNVLSIPAEPFSASMTMGDTTYRASGLDGKNFFFAKHLALKADTTRVQLELAYSYTDTVGGKREPKQKVVPYALTFLRAAGAALPTGMGQNCKEQADISLYHDGQPVTRVTADFAGLEARLTMPDGSLCKGCTLEVLSSTNRVKDQEYPVMVPSGGYLSGTFQREVSVSPAVGDGRLQHLPGDSIVVLFVSPENPLDRVRKAFPYTDAPAVLRLGGQNDYARTGNLLPVPPSEPQWLLVVPPGVQAVPGDRSVDWRAQPGPMAPQDSLRYVGLTVEASRTFLVDIRVFSNLGQFVNKLTFSISQAEFLKLEKSAKGDTRLMKVLWDGRTDHGNPVSTGAYVFKTTVTLLKIPGIAEDDATRVDYRRFGVLRSL
ncbi:MAG TPA: VWA domain-containing protein [Fibrobacteria bacterium]|nr:VWA domain-containing protein [Fibrobacteria bacterium]